MHPAGIRLTQLSDMKWYLALFTGRGICFFELGEQYEEEEEGVREDSISKLFFIFGRKRRKIRE